MDLLLAKLRSITSKQSTRVAIKGSIDFSQLEFKEIVPQQGTVTYVDGSNMELLGSAAFSLQLIRVHACTYKDKKIASKTQEFHVIVEATSEGTYTTHFFDADLSFPDIKVTDSSIATSTAKASPRRVAELVRRYAEVNLASTFENVVIDGNRKAELPCIQEALQNLPALSKTSELVTDTGDAASVVVNKLTSFKTWWCKVAEQPDRHIFLAKLHSHSKYVFKIELPSIDISLFPLLAFHSSDPVFLGYPYGLVEADKHARITHQERDYYKLRLLSKVGDVNHITQYLNTINAHDILDGV